MALVFLMLLFAGFSLATRPQPLLSLALAALFCTTLGVGLARLETWRAGTAMLGGDIATQLTGTVVVMEKMATGRVRLTIDVVATARPVLRYAPQRVRLSARSVPEGVGAGSTITGLVRLLPPSGPVRPGSYDFSFESYFDGIGASGFFLRGPELAPAAGEPKWRMRFAASVERTRASIARRITDRIGGPEGEIAAALVVGIRAGIPEPINEALRRAGIYHIISISGLHMALVAGTIMGFLRAGFALFPGFASRFAVKKLAAAIALVGLAGYLFISGGEVAAQRSFIMLAVMLVAVLFDRAALTMRNLAISAIVVIALSPHEVVGPSFQMSFAATAALVGAYAAWGEWRARRGTTQPPSRALAARLARWAFSAMAALAATSIVAGGATAIYAAWHFQQMPSLGLLTNLLAMPVVSILVMPFAVLGLMAMPFGLDGPFFSVMGEGLRLTIAIARWFAARSPADSVGAIAPVAVVLLTLALAVATVATTRLRVLAVPLAAAGLLALVPPRPGPDVLVSEDAKLVAVALGGGRVASNRARPSDFTFDNWKRAMDAGTVVPPGAASGFSCADGLCLTTHPSGVAVAHATTVDAARRSCAVALLIIVEDASATGLCSTDATVLTARDLALFGSVAIVFEPPATGAEPHIAVSHAIAAPYRNWHAQRRFSRSARGMPPYVRKPSAAVP